jgi:asparagine synthase (glutamine-hydrolysing)
MSAIAGIFHRDNRPVDPSNLACMVKTLAHRGPDGSHLWCCGSVGLGHCMLFTTPESLGETLPLLHPTGKFAITADARIDNRAELVSRLHLDARPIGELSDSQIILAAYERWGEACADQLLGAFAFVIWDAPRNQLFCARDHLGVKSFYYYLSERFFCFASEIKAILGLPGVPCRLNEVRVADHLSSLLEDKTHTFYQEIYRLPPAHKMCIQANRASKELYWTLDPNHEITLPSDEEYVESFRELFSGVIRDNLRSAFPIGSQLSGGLDSSSITCIARDLLTIDNRSTLKTFSFTFDEEAPYDELPFINHVLAQNSVTPCFGRGDLSGPLTYIDSFLDCADEPFHLPNFFQTWDLFKLIQTHGIRVVLDGLDGDSTISHGWTYLTELAEAGRWRELRAEIEASISLNEKNSSLEILKRHGIPALQKRAQNGQWLRFISDTGEIAKHFQIPRWSLIYRHGIRPVVAAPVRRIRNWRRATTSVKEVGPFINEDFAYHIGLRERVQEVAGARLQPPQTERESHWYGLTTGLFSHVLEKMDSLAAPFGLDVRHPFMDKRLIQFCLALPPQQKRNQGWDRLILRRAMTGILPSEVQWRPNKADFSVNFVRGMLRFDKPRFDELLCADHLCVSKYVNVEKLRDSYRRFVATESIRGDQATSLWLIAVLELWLRRTGLAIED